MKILPNQSNTTIASSSVNNNTDTSGASFEELLNKLSAKRPAASVQATRLHRLQLLHSLFPIQHRMRHCRMPTIHWISWKGWSGC